MRDWCVRLRLCVVVCVRCVSLVVFERERWFLLLLLLLLLFAVRSRVPSPSTLLADTSMH